MDDEALTLARMREEFIEELLRTTDHIVGLLNEICKAVGRNGDLLGELANCEADSNGQVIPEFEPLGFFLARRERKAVNYRKE